MRKTQIKISRKKLVDTESDPREYLFQDEDYRQEDQARLDAWKNNDWYFVGVRAKAEIRIPNGVNEDCWILSSMETPGLWAIESDSDETYFEEVYQEEKATLLEMLESLKDYEIVEPA